MHPERPASAAVLLALSILGATALPGSATAGECTSVPDPSRSTLDTLGQSGACQFVFRADGSADEVVLRLVLRDAFDQLLAGCTASIELSSLEGSLCACEPLTQVQVTDSEGVAEFRFFRLGGHGIVLARLESECVNPPEQCGYALIERTFQFTSPDLDASCEALPASAVTVLDLGLWAAALGIYAQRADYDCSGAIDVIDLGGWASGLGNGCGP